MQNRWGVVALSVVAVEETQDRHKIEAKIESKNRVILFGHIKPTTQTPVVEIHPTHTRNPENSPIYLFDGFLFAI